MRYGSVCSGIEAATVAWHGLGWEPAFFSEIEKFPREVLAHHYPDVPLHGDFTTIGKNQYGSIDLLVGGTPCQSFSIAGLRKGLDDDRGNLALEFIRLAQRELPEWIVWENVPGVLSSNGGRDFGTFLGALGQIGYGFAYRVLDAQYFGVAQRRRRVFVVGHLGDWRRAAAVLFERESLSGNPAPSREARKEAAGNAGVRTYSGSTESTVAGTLETTCHDYSRADSFNMVAFQSTANACDAAAAGRNVSPTMRCDAPAVAFDLRGRNGGAMPEGPHDTVSIRAASGGSSRSYIANTNAVRRLTPVECERLQGFPDNYTNIKDNCPDGPRYKALGNSMAVPVMKWIGTRIKELDDEQGL